MVGEDRIAQELAAIKAREAAAKAAIEAGLPEVDTGSFGASQLGLCPVVADKWGRMWRVDGMKLTRIYPGPPIPLRSEMIDGKGK